MIGTVAAVWQYPVKSMQGERVARVELDPSGPVGDRAWGVLDLASQSLLSAKRTRALLDAAVADGDVTVPGRGRHGIGAPALDAALSDWLERPVRMVHVGEDPTLPQSMHLDNEDPESLVIRWRTPRGRYVDLFPLHIVTTATLDAQRARHPALDWDVRRFRPNLVLDTGLAEAALLGATLRIGDAVVHVPDQLAERCVMITHAQPDLAGERGLLRALARDAGRPDAPLTAGSAIAQLGCYGEVVTPGQVAEGMAVERVS